MFLPDKVKLIIDRLENNGFCAFAVGGCVRDTLLSRTPDDWDICTDALPDKILDIFSDYTTVKTGIKHGTVTVVIEKIPFEITTFRIDGEYYDNRHPDNITFTPSLKEDLKRRDFTINALAYNSRTGFCDYSGGMSDLKNKIIRCVGIPDIRFSEDALRILRAIRFSSQLGFKIDISTEESLRKNKTLLKNISKERIKSEFVKILLSDDCNVYYKYKDILSVFTHDIIVDKYFSNIIATLPRSIPIRLAAFILNGTKKNFREDIANYSKNFLYEMKFDKKTITQTYNIIKNYNIKIIDNLLYVRKLLSDIDFIILSDILFLKKSSTTDYNEIKLYENVLDKMKYIKEKKLCTKISELDINGNDLIEHGYAHGAMTGILLKKILYMLIENNLENKKEILLNTALKIVQDSEGFN